MASQVENDLVTFTAGGTIDQYTLVYQSSGGTTVAEASTPGAAGRAIAVAQEAKTSGELVTCALLHPGRTYKVLSGGAVTAGAKVYLCDTGGIVDDAVNGFPLGIAITAAAASSEVFEILYNPSLSKHVNVISGSAKSLANADSGALVVCPSGGQVELPAGAQGLFFDFIATAVTSTVDIKIRGGALTEVVAINGTTKTTGETVTIVTGLATVGGQARFFHDGTYWNFISANASTITSE
jgi:hypothetical protein